MCYMTRISEPRPFRAVGVPDSVFTVVSWVIEMSLTCLTCPASGQKTAGSGAHVSTLMAFFRDKEEKGFCCGFDSHLTLC